MNAKREKVLPIELDWRFGILLSMGRRRLKELMAFHRQAEKNFSAAMKELRKKEKAFSASFEYADDEHLMVRRDEIESLLDRGQTLEIVGLYTFLERFLNSVIEHLRDGGANIPLPRQTGFSLHKMRDYLAREAKIDMNRNPFEWKALERLQEIRNCIVHADGWITNDFASRLGRLGMKMKAETQIELPESYFAKALKIVSEACEAVYEQCDEKFGYKMRNKAWLQPRRKFTSDELREILQEATEAGVAAREKTTKELLKRAKKRRRKDEDSCGWVWLEIDPKLLLHIQKLDIPNVKTSYAPGMIVKDFHLYLDDVRHYQRMSATSDGMRAAAEVLKKHGINCHQHSLAD